MTEITLHNIFKAYTTDRNRSTPKGLFDKRGRVKKGKWMFVFETMMFAETTAAIDEEVLRDLIKLAKTQETFCG